MLSVGEKLIKSNAFPDIETMTSLRIDSVQKYKKLKTYTIKELNEMSK